MDLVQVLFYRLCRIGFLVYLIDFLIFCIDGDYSLVRFFILLVFFFLFNCSMSYMERRVVTRHNNLLKNKKKEVKFKNRQPNRSRQ